MVYLPYFGCKADSKFGLCTFLESTNASFVSLPSEDDENA
jgi:hypothetical protein